MPYSRHEPKRRIRTISDGDQTFPSYKELILNLLQSFFPNMWNSTNPCGHIMPTRFSYQCPLVCDRQYQIALDSNQCLGVAPVKHRHADEAERMVFESIVELTRRGIGAPFLCVHHLDFKCAPQESIPEIFEISMDERMIDQFTPCFREYDFILIGPTFGLILIEVKGSDFAHEITPGRNYLPERYRESLNQLSSSKVKALLSLLELGANFKIPAKSVRRILFTPRLAKARYNGWFERLTNGQKISMSKSIDQVQQWFREDLVDDSSLFETLRDEIQKPGFHMNFAQYHRNVWILAALRSWPVFKDNRDLASLRSLYSDSHAQSDECSLIRSQRFPSGSKRFKNDPHQLYLRISSDKFITLTQEQCEVARNDSKRCFLAGTAGTGKTTILMERAIEQQHRGRSVLVLAPESIMLAYQSVFEVNGCSGYEIASWPKFKTDMLATIRNPRDIIWDIYRKKAYIGDLAREYVSNFQNDFINNDLFRKLFEFDQIIIDDAFDLTLTSPNKGFLRTKALFLSLVIMARSKMVDKNKSIWVGFDLYTIEWLCERDFLLYRQSIERVINTKSELGEDAYFTCAPLHKVMRNSENVYKIAYNPDVMEQFPSNPPYHGHKTSGGQLLRKRIFWTKPQQQNRRHISTSESEHAHSQPAADDQLPKSVLDDLWSQTKHYLRQFEKDGSSFNQIAIIVGGDTDDTNLIVEYLLNQCKTERPEIPAGRLEWKYLQLQSITASQKARSSLDPDNSKLTIDSWQQASSKEWDIVIYVEITDFRRLAHPFDDMRNLQRYRGRTRAVGRLVEIFVVEVSNDGVGRVCCPREMDLFHDKCLDFDQPRRSRYFLSNVHSSKCRANSDRSASKVQRHESSKQLAKFLAFFKDDLRWDKPNYVARLQNKMRKRHHSTPADFCSQNTKWSLHPAVVLDCNLYSRVKKEIRNPEGEAVDGELAGTRFAIPSSHASKSWIIRDVVRVLERTSLFSGNGTLPIVGHGLLGSCVVTQVNNVLLAAASNEEDRIHGQYLRINVFEILNRDAEYNYRDFVNIEREMYPH